MSGEKKIKDPIHDYNEEYRRGAHWDVEEPSSNMAEFVELIKGSEKVLDAGCGTGRDAIFLAKEGFRVVGGVDASSVAIELAKNRAEELELSNLDFAVGKIEELPFSDALFDATYSGYVVGGTTLPQQAQELARVLKPNKILYVAMFTRTKYEQPSERDEETPLPFVLQAFDKQFRLESQAQDSYTEEDDYGKHVHERLKLVLRKVQT